ncbi:MAG: hypothetical protein WDZ91_08035 [Paenibacillaceae bacterium]
MAYYKDPKFIAFLDILGFKDIVSNNKHEMLERKLRDFSAIIENLNGIFTSIGDEIPLPQKIEVLTVSDSIIIWTDDDSQESFALITIAVSEILRHSFYNGTPLRGALTRGSLSVIQKKHQTNIFGIGLINAYLLESTLNMSGCAIENDTFRYNVVSQKLIKDKYIVKYDTSFKPVKNNLSKNEYVINWVNESVVQSDISKYFTAHNKKIDNESVYTKILNTANYIEFIKKNNLLLDDE